MYTCSWKTLYFSSGPAVTNFPLVNTQPQVWASNLIPFLLKICVENKWFENFGDDWVLSFCRCIQCTLQKFRFSYLEQKWLSTMIFEVLILIRVHAVSWRSLHYFLWKVWIKYFLNLFQESAHHCQTDRDSRTSFFPPQSVWRTPEWGWPFDNMLM